MLLRSMHICVCAPPCVFSERETHMFAHNAHAHTDRCNNTGGCEPYLYLLNAMDEILAIGKDSMVSALVSLI